MDNSDYARVIRRGGSRVGVYILFFIVIGLLGVTAYILFWPQKTTKPTEATITPSLADTQLGDDSAKTPAVESVEDTPVTDEYISPALKERIIQSHHGINTVIQIIDAVPTNTNLTMVTYSDGKFLFEVLAPGDSDLRNVSTRLQEKLYSANIKVLSRDRRNIKGQQYNQALMSGGINLEERPAGLTSIQEPRYLGADALKQLLTAMCQENGLRIKQFDVGIEKTEDEMMIKPIIFSVVGLKGNVINLLQQLMDENLNLSIYKVSLIADDIDLNNPNVTLVINMSLYRQA